jgi:hypothetical protein
MTGDAPSHQMKTSPGLFPLPPHHVRFAFVPVAVTAFSFRSHVGGHAADSIEMRAIREA